MRAERGWLLSAGTVEAVAAVGAVCLPAGSCTGFLVGGPLLAAYRLTVRVTAVLTMVAVVLAVLLPDPRAPAVTFPHAAGVLAVAAGGAWAVWLARARRATEAALARMTRIAELAQDALVRPLPERLGGLALAAHTASATEGARLGGDVHDVLLTGAGPRLLIGDVKGHGMDAARLGAAVLCAFRQTAAAEPDLVALARTLDHRIRADLGEEDFVTLLLADFTPHEVRLVNCGHPAPLRTGRRLELLQPPSPSPPLGLSPRPCQQRIVLSPEQRLLFYTDGLTEARDAQGAMFPLDRRVKAALAAPALGPALDGLLDLLRQHTAGTIGDDLTLLLVQPTPDLFGGTPEGTEDRGEGSRGKESREPPPLRKA